MNDDTYLPGLIIIIDELNDLIEVVADVLLLHQIRDRTEEISGERVATRTGGSRRGRHGKVGLHVQVPIVQDRGKLKKGAWRQLFQTDENLLITSLLMY